MKNKATAIKPKVIQMLFGELDPDSALCARVSSSFRIVLKEMLKRTPTPKHTIPGTINAARQLHNPVNVPATRGAKTNPKLPNSPFNPKAVQVLDVLETSQDMPTG